MTRASAAVKKLGTGLRRGASRFRSRLFSRFNSRNRLLAYLAILGPGIIAASSGNEASGIATYSTAGADYGYTLLWTFIPMTICFVVAQEICVRMGVVTGKGLADLIREQFGVRPTVFVMLALLVANSGIVVAEFVGIAQASELLGISRYIAVPITAVIIWWLVVRGTPKRVEQAFLLMSLVFLTYVAAAFLAKPNWEQVGKEFVTPTFSLETGYLFMIVALIGTTITPFMQVFVQSSVVEKELTTADYKPARADAIIGVLLANSIAAFILIAAGTSLHHTHIATAADAAQALAPVAGEYAKYLFAVGLFGASMLAMGVLPLATAYSLSEALGFEKGLSHSFREAPIFLGIFTALIVLGSVVALIPGIPQIQLLLLTQCINGILLPVLLVTVLLLSNDAELMGEYKNSTAYNWLAWTVTLTVSILSLLLIGRTIFDIFTKV
jgi:NRAMP (natural resistance-associated macrophage protein)-like metal ion transporter